FAGHPTVGAALALRDAGLVGDSVTLVEGVGPVSVTFEDGLATLTTPGAPEAVEDVADPGDVAAALGLGIEDLHPQLGPRGWSVGVPFTVVAVRDVDVLGRCAIDFARWRESMAHTSAPELYVLTPLDGIAGRQWRARMF